MRELGWVGGTQGVGGASAAEPRSVCGDSWIVQRASEVQCGCNSYGRQSRCGQPRHSRKYLTKQTNSRPSVVVIVVVVVAAAAFSLDAEAPPQTADIH